MSLGVGALYNNRDKLKAHDIAFGGTKVAENLIIFLMTVVDASRSHDVGIG